MSDSIVIVGAGIIGLNTALVLAERGHGRHVTVVAEYLPGDTAATYTSPWAGCNFSAISGTDANALRWDRLGYTQLMKTASADGERASVKRTPAIEYWEDHLDTKKIKAMSAYLEDFAILAPKELPEGIKIGISFTTVTVNAPKYIEHLYRRLKSQYGVRFRRQKLSGISSAFASEDTRIAFNCTGLAAGTLAGVEDARCYPTRGQIVLARAPSVTKTTMRHGKEFVTYIIPRPGSNGNVVLGGYLQKGVGDASTYSYEVQSILERTKSLEAELAKEEPEVLAAFAGLRPSREGGARVEKERVVVHGRERMLVHDYGAGGTGFQAGYGMASDSVDLVADLLSGLADGRTRAKL
ncbi:hypothetical protein GMORB2_7607 [Geosmithia morbida]|uniref:FAD dependent oxidoreductase domain-containing protein n=1 Tax=Geosmithia morbida TaxID=1094350 RepID=A0A9P5D504_9HYPO|nr:uncharacterized protein GMORB2_7607 [Geosmithia morbida]KAF4122014.1 hypothetical protein GMORB2_7607 [Geosmithia morbida]